MKKIGFKNFRRFVEFPELAYGPITFLVGRNNSGKSTFVKALLLIDNYLKSDKIQFFSFADKILEDTNIVTFGRAKNKSNENEQSISFTFQIEDFEVFIDITANEDDTEANVTALFIKNINNGYYYNFTRRY
jgi:predicted ATP-dependent endonuclease of OLD family